MTDKILAVVEKMLDDPDKISEIVPWSKEYYFRYADHFWSTQERQHGEYCLYFYPQWAGTLSQLAKECIWTPPIDTTVTYDDHRYFRNGDVNLFEKLYRLLQERHLGADKALERILAQ